HKNRNRLTHRDRSEYKTHSSVMAVCKSVTIPGMTGHVRRNTQVRDYVERPAEKGLLFYAQAAISKSNA
ncbi:hypothetical protein, partial [Marinobacter salarius]